MSSAGRALAAVAAAVAAQGWLILAATGGFWILAVAGHVVADATWLIGLAGHVSLVLILGGLGSFLVHECAHVVALMLPGGTRSVVVESTLLRVSVTPEGDLTPARAALAALAGPAAAGVVGLSFLAVGLTPIVAWLHLAHLLFLLPVFGDGRALVVAVRALGR